MEELSKFPISSCNDESTQECCPDIVLECYGAAVSVVLCFQCGRKMVFQRSVWTLIIEISMMACRNEFNALRRRIY